MSFLDSSHPRSVLWLFYSFALLSAIMFSAASYAPVSYYKPLLVLALVTALAAAFFLELFLRSKDERERQINYRALTFAFVGTLVFSLVVGVAQTAWISFRVLARASCSDDRPVELWTNSVFLAGPMKTRLRVLRAEKEWSQAELATHVGVARGTINAIETGKYDPSLPLAFKIARAFGKSVEEVFLYQENEQPATTNPAV